ncbi:Polycystin cation channel, partial [Globisporangium splendens]
MPATVKYAPSMKKLPLFVHSSTDLGDKSTSGPTSIPREFLLRDLKEKRKFRLLSRKLTVFVTFMVVYLVVLLMDCNISGRLLLLKALMSKDSSCGVMSAGAVVRRIISKELIDTSRAASGMTFAGINSIGAFWDWFTNSFLDSVYTTANSDGLPRSSDEMYTIASHTKIVGGFHLIQKSYLEPTVNQTCFSAKGESTDSFGATNGTKASEAELLTLKMFQYSTNNDSVGGFQTYFLRSTTDGADELATVKLMQSYRWIDRQTSSVEITMPMYNSNLKIWSVVNLQIGFDLAGGVTPKSFIHVTNIEPYNLSG